MNKTLNLTYLLIAFTAQVAFNQTLTPSLLATTGNIESVSGYSLSYSIGELAVATSYNSEYYLTQGFQQAEKGIDTTGSITTIIVNPNPVILQHLYIDFYDPEVFNFGVEVFNLKGSKVLEETYSQNYYGQKKRLDMGMLPKGLYIVHVYSIEGKLSKKFKIVKM